MAECSRCLRTKYELAEANMRQAEVVNAARRAIEDDTEEAWMALADTLERHDKQESRRMSAIHYSS